MLERQSLEEDYLILFQGFLKRGVKMLFHLNWKNIQILGIFLAYIEFNKSHKMYSQFTV